MSGINPLHPLHESNNDHFISESEITKVINNSKYYDRSEVTPVIKSIFEATKEELHSGKIFKLDKERLAAIHNRNLAKEELERQEGSEDQFFSDEENEAYIKGKKAEEKAKTVKLSDSEHWIPEAEIQAAIKEGKEKTSKLSDSEHFIPEAEIQAVIKKRLPTPQKLSVPSARAKKTDWKIATRGIPVLKRPSENTPQQSSDPEIKTPKTTSTKPDWRKGAGRYPKFNPQAMANKPKTDN